jgi:hypothetical protein
VPTSVSTSHSTGVAPPEPTPDGPVDHDALRDVIAAHVAAIRTADDEAVAAAREALIALLRGPEGGLVREDLEVRARGELLEVQWELEEVLDLTAPKKAAPPAPKAPEPPPAEKPLTQADLVPVYDDPRGLVLYKTRKGDRWFATQVDPRTGQPQTFELMPHEVSQLQRQLAGSPYWLLGA